MRVEHKADTTFTLGNDWVSDRIGIHVANKHQMGKQKCLVTVARDNRDNVRHIIMAVPFFKKWDREDAFFRCFLEDSVGRYGLEEVLNNILDVFLFLFWQK
jgi:hypothetical protein